MKPLCRFLSPLPVIPLALLGGFAPESLGAEVGTPGLTTTSSTTTHTTATDVTVDQRTATGTSQQIVNGGDQVQFTGSLSRALGSPQIQAATRAALQALQAQIPPFPQGASLRLLSRTLGSGGTSTTSSTTTSAPTHTTFETVVGPANIFIGANKSVPFAVVAGEINTNTNVHTEFFTTNTTTLSGGAPTVETLLQERVIVVNLDTVFSALDSALPVVLSQRDSLVAAHSGIGDVNNRILRAWQGPNAPGGAQGDGELDGNARLFAKVDAGWLSQGGRGTAAGFLDTRESASVGAEWKLKPSFRVGVAANYIHSDTDFSSGLGSRGIDGAAVSLYATWRSDAAVLPAPAAKDGKPAVHKPSGSSYADLLYSAGYFSDTLERNTLTGSTARSTSEDWSHLVALNVGHTFAISERFATGPFASLTYIHGRLGGSSEHGGGGANVSYAAQDYDSLVSVLGWQASWKVHTRWGVITPLVHAGWERENLKDAGAVSTALLASPFSTVGANGSLASLGSFSVGSRRESARYDALSVGASVTAEIGGMWGVTLGVAERTDFGARNDFSVGLQAGRRF